MGSQLAPAAAPGRAAGGHGLHFLILQHHWQAVIDFLFEADMSCKPKLSHATFRVICVDLTYRDNGEVFGSGARLLYIARENTSHFVPLTLCW